MTLTSRGALSATLRSAGQRVTLMTCHLKSKLISYDRQPGVVAGATFAANDEGERLRYAGYALHRRTTEAMTCRDALDQIMAAAGDQPGAGTGAGIDMSVIFLGDLSDEPFRCHHPDHQGPAGSEIDFSTRLGASDQ